MRTSRVLSLWFVFGLLGFLGCDDTGTRDAETPQLSIEPAEFIFPRLATGTTEIREVWVRNQGAGPLRLKGLTEDFGERRTQYALYYAIEVEGEDAQEFVAMEAGIRSFPPFVVVPPQASMRLILEYTAADERGAIGALGFESNDPDHLSFQIPVRGEAGGPEIDVNPTHLDFGAVSAGDTLVKTVIVANLGTQDLTVEDLSLNGSADFTVTVGGEVVEDFVLAPTEQVAVDVTYAPLVEGPDQGELVVRSSDPHKPEVIVSLTANGARPCIRVTPGSLDFPAVLVGQTASRPVTIESCGGQALRVKSVTMRDDSSPQYSVNIPAELPVLIPAQLPNEPPPARTLTVDFTPLEILAYGGTLVIVSDDPLNTTIEVPILGRGTVNACPQAVVEQAHFEVQPLDIVSLDGSRSVDPDGPDGLPVRYIWTVADAPDGSSAVPAERYRNPARPLDTTILDDITTPEALFFADLAGHYTLHLTVEDTLGLQAPGEFCEQPDAVVHIEAVPGHDIHIQMVWDTPRDRDQTDDDGSDIDLHLLHPQGRTWAGDQDCYYRNVSPDWGIAGPPGDPILDRDDTSGSGPENINVDAPENTQALGGQYRVGVHYYSDRDLGASEVTVRVFFGAVQVGEWIEVLQNTGRFWEVADIFWTEGERRVLPIGRTYNTAPSPAR